LQGLHSIKKREFSPVLTVKFRISPLFVYLREVKQIQRTYLRLFDDVLYLTEQKEQRNNFDENNCFFLAIFIIKIHGRRAFCQMQLQDFFAHWDINKNTSLEIHNPSPKAVTLNSRRVIEFYMRRRQESLSLESDFCVRVLLKVAACIFCY
jgi:hypothetical protein